MASKADFTEQEWDALRKGITGTGMLVSLSDRDFTDTFGEVGALGKYLAGQQTTAASALVRELTRGSSGFGLTASPEKVRAETMTALQSAVATLEAKAPDELDAYRQLVLGVADVVAQAKGGGVAPVEQSMIDEIRAALGAA
ncbi:MAG TPA: hypothetical protein VFL03_12215 [Candidatus Limnocylindrales bacterium]|nr:hypothetical protein [Candidatus Limnocylindrales bacterium]